MTDRDKRSVEQRIEELWQRRRAKEHRGDDADGPPMGELTERQEEQIDAILSDARREHPEALRDAEEQLRREHESGELAEAREERANSEPARLNGAEKPAADDGLTEGELSLLDALTGGYNRKEREAGDGGD